jgi:hypothetical protein
MAWTDRISSSFRADKKRQQVVQEQEAGAGAGKSVEFANAIPAACRAPIFPAPDCCSCLLCLTAI